MRKKLKKKFRDTIMYRKYVRVHRRNIRVNFDSEPINGGVLKTNYFKPIYEHHKP